MTSPVPTARHQPRRAAIGSFVGTALEWFDFFIYGTMAALVFGPLFFPSHSGTAGTLAAFATLAVGFAARPLGGVLVGHFGDRVGRKKMLVLTLIVMGVSTTLIGCLPTYEQIGALAPVLLITLRILQGLAVGGEWGGAALMSIEHAPKHRRGFFGSATQTGSPAGLLLASAAVWAASSISGDKFEVWGWRLPFLSSVLLIIVGLLIRLKLTETPTFVAAVEDTKKPSLPIVVVLRHHWRSVLLGVGMACANNVIFYTVATYTISYTTTHKGVDKSEVLHHLTIVSAVYLFAIPFFGFLADKVGLRRQVAIAATCSALFIFPFFALIGTGRSGLILLAMVLALSVFQAGAYAPQPGIFCGLFAPQVRYTGASLVNALPASLAGGTAPLVATALYAWSGSTWPMATYIVVLCAIAVTCALVAREAPEPTVSDGTATEMANA